MMEVHPNAQHEFQFRPVCRSGSRWEPSNEGKRGVLRVIFSFLTVDIS